MVPNDALTNAFQLLASVVREFHAVSRPALGATIKPAVCTRGNFTEQMLGFTKFGDFLRAAQTAGYVQLRPTTGGDISVWPAGNAAQSPPSVPSIIAAVAPTSQPVQTNPTSVRVRQDLWSAFNSFAGKWVYDSTTDVAFKETESGIAWNASGVQHNLIPIPAGRERVIEWMRSFANTQGPETSTLLSAALNREGGPYQFNSLVRSNNLLRSWSHFHIQQVLAAIGAWASANNIQPKNVTTEFRPLFRSPLSIGASPRVNVIPSVTPSVIPLAPLPQEAIRPAELGASPMTTRLDGLIDNLIDELIKLRGLLQIVGTKQC